MAVIERGSRKAGTEAKAEKPKPRRRATTEIKKVELGGVTILPGGGGNDHPEPPSSPRKRSTKPEAGLRSRGGAQKEGPPARPAAEQPLGRRRRGVTKLTVVDPVEPTPIPPHGHHRGGSPVKPKRRGAKR